MYFSTCRPLPPGCSTTLKQGGGSNLRRCRGPGQLGLDISNPPRIPCTVYEFIFAGLAAPGIDRLSDPERMAVSMVLRSDNKRFKEELAAADGSRDIVVEKYRSVFLERDKVRVSLAHANPATHSFRSSQML